MLLNEEEVIIDIGKFSNARLGKTWNFFTLSKYKVTLLEKGISSCFSFGIWEATYACNVSNILVIWF
jgi:hypothetical protein